MTLWPSGGLQSVWEASELLLILPELPNIIYVRVHAGCSLRQAGAQCLYYPFCITFPIEVNHLTCVHTLTHTESL